MKLIIHPIKITLNKQTFFLDLDSDQMDLINVCLIQRHPQLETTERRVTNDSQTGLEL